MMRLARRASLLIALSMLASVATAQAECAWVLWGVALLSSGEQYWGVISAYSLEDGGKIVCERSREGANKRAAQEKGEDKRSGRQFLCLPDTVDPRGPKGK